jgi:hypothetical protein
MTAVNRSTNAVAIIDCRFCQQQPPLLPSTANNDRWLLAVVVVDYVAAAMAFVNGSNSGCC